MLLVTLFIPAKNHLILEMHSIVTSKNVLAPFNLAHPVCQYRASALLCRSAIKIDIHCVPKTCDHVFDDKLKLNCSSTKTLVTLITTCMSVGHRQVFFLFSHVTYACTYFTIGICRDLNISKN